MACEAKAGSGGNALRRVLIVEPIRRGSLARKLRRVRLGLENRNVISWSLERMQLVESAYSSFSECLKQGLPMAAGKIGGTEGKALEAAERPWRAIFRPDVISSRMNLLYERSGVYPRERSMFFRWARYWGREVLPQCDYLARWRGEDDDWIKARLGLRAHWLRRNDLSSTSDWINLLAGKKVLVVSSFPATIRAQLPRLPAVWGRESYPLTEKNTALLPCPTYAHLQTPTHADWFLQLDELCCAMDDRVYDVALIGAGAWSLPLSVHAKRRGKIGLHLGGELQIFFGILGARWEGTPMPVNESWTKPLMADTPEALKEAGRRFKKDCAYW